ncbi:MAG: peptidylprolyl isomerase [Steroidobacteraceae bacterium]|jgi:parvulin-like peptidyl-prolyl isomerase
MNDELNPQPSRRPAIIAGAIAVLVIGGGWYAWSHGWFGARAKPASTAAAGKPSTANVPPAGLRVLAEVNGKNITAEEIAPLVGQGIDRAVAVDRYVTRLLAADAANEMYPEESKVARAAAEREVLSQLFLSRRTAELRQATTDADIDKFYKENVRDADYANYRLAYYLTGDENDAATMARNIAGNDREAIGKFQAVNKQGDGFVPLGQVPYGLGQLVASAKTGDFIGPFRVRDGLLILQIQDTRAGKKPPLTQVKDEIRNLIVSRQLNDELLARREKASIKLKL